MNITRRRILAALSVGSVSVAAVFGSGAFSTVEVERDVSLRVAGDENALLTLAPNDDPDAATGGISTVGDPLEPYGGDVSRYLTDPETEKILELLITESNIEGEAGGLNDEAVTRFSNLIRLENRGKQAAPIRITGVPDGLEFFAYGVAADGPVSLVTDVPPGDDTATFPVNLDAGSIVGVTVQVDSGILETSQVEETVTIIADTDGTLDQPQQPDL